MARFVAVLLALTLALGIVSAQQTCEVCQKSTGKCDNGAQTSGSKNSFIDGVDQCVNAVKLVRCGRCKNGNFKDTTCCALTCTEQGGKATVKCACGPPLANQDKKDVYNNEGELGACGDPHFQGAFGVHYDFHGLPERDFNLISDRDLAVNAHFIGQDGEETGVDGTWIGALGFMWSQDSKVRTATFTVKQGGEAYNDALPFAIELDGEELSGEALQAVADNNDRTAFYKDEGVAIIPSNVAYSVRIQIRNHISMVITAADHEHPVGNHIDFGIGKLNVTDHVHGALGQTFAASRAEALKAAAATVGTIFLDASDIVEGKDTDYMTSSLVSTDFKFNRFNPQATAFEKFNVIRKLLGLATEAVHESPVAESLNCDNLAGNVRCYL